jgi:hypothetical protein
MLNVTGKNVTKNVKPAINWIKSKFFSEARTNISNVKI